MEHPGEPGKNKENGAESHGTQDSIQYQCSQSGPGNRNDLYDDSGEKQNNEPAQHPPNGPAVAAPLRYRRPVTTSILLPARRYGPLGSLWIRVGIALGCLAITTLLVFVERDGYKDSNGTPISWLDALYYATVTLSTTGAANGDTFRVVRTGLGAFTLDVGGLKTIAAGTAATVEVAYNGSAWILIGYQPL